MKRYLPKTIMVGLSFLIGVFLVMPVFQLMAQDSRAAQPDKPAAPVAPAEVDSRLAGMSDEQVRQAYSEKLKQDASGQHQAGRSDEEASWVFISTKFYGGAQAVAAVLTRVASFFTDEGTGSGRWGIAITKLTDGRGLPYLLATVAGLAVIIVLGIIFRWLFLRTTSAIQENLITAVRLGRLQFLGRVLARMA